MLQRASFDKDAVNRSALATNNTEDSKRIIERLVAMSDKKSVYSFDKKEQTQGFRVALSISSGQGSILPEIK